MDKSILAYFRSPEEAKGVLSKLHALRAIDARIDRISRYPGSGNSLSASAGGEALELGSFTREDLETGTGADVLMAADPANSGLSQGGEGGVSGRDILLTAIVTEDVHHKALRLVEEAGGVI